MVIRSTVFLLLLSPLFSFAQVPDDSIINKKVITTGDLYYQALGDKSPLYNGKVYKEYYIKINDGSPYFLSETFSEGDIYYDDMVFYKVPLLYDLVRDELVLFDTFNFNRIVPRADKINRFTLLHHTFIRIENTGQSQLAAGFYDQLYDGRSGLYVKRKKNISEKLINQGLEEVVSTNNSYYIRKDGLFYYFKTKKAMLEILKDKKKDIQQYLSKNKVKYRQDPERAMQMAVRYYDQLKN